MVQGEAFADAWIAAWNHHDLAAILSHYGEDTIFVSPAAARVTGERPRFGPHGLAVEAAAYYE